MELVIPNLSLVVLIGPSGSGKSTFAQKHFRKTEILSSDYFRGLVGDDPNDQSISSDAFEALHYIAEKRMKLGKLTVIDATNLQTEGRKQLVALAQKHHVIPLAIVFNLPEKICLEHNKLRPERSLPKRVISKHCLQLKKSRDKISTEGFRYVYQFHTVEKVEQAQLVRQPLWVDRREEKGPFDIIGDVHGCFPELVGLLEKLGYVITESDDAGEKKIQVTHPAGRKVVFVGDLVDRGPDTPAVLRLVMSMIETGIAYCVMGNHDGKLWRKLNGRNVQINHGLEVTLEQFAKESPEWVEQVRHFLANLRSHYVLDGGKLVVAHAGLKEELQGRSSKQVREFAMFGEKTGRIDEYGLPERVEWARNYRGRAFVVFGHTPHRDPVWLNNTVNIDTGCVFGGKLTALRYPEKETVFVNAKEKYAENLYWAKAMGNSSQRGQDQLIIEDVSEKFISTRYLPAIHIAPKRAAASMERLSREAIQPNKLIYLPPTMSPAETCQEGSWLEHPKEAFAYYQKEGQTQVICEEKHMGSRAIVLLFRDPTVAVKRFGWKEEAIGVCYTRTGRRFFDDFTWETAFLRQIQTAMEQSGFWGRFGTDWVCLDGELMPWSAKAQELLKRQYAAVGTAATHSLAGAVGLLSQALENGLDVTELRQRYQQRLVHSNRYVETYRKYCWEIDSPTDLKFAPFHLLATEGAAHTDKDHLWHMKQLTKLAQHHPILQSTRYQVVDLQDPQQVVQAIDWWENLTATGGEGMVVKPLAFIPKGSKGLIQPAIKCRGKEYLRMIYGPDYTEEANLIRLRGRSLRRKGALALREFAMGLEALERFVAKEPLSRVHECIFGILALESEPLDPTL